MMNLQARQSFLGQESTEILRKGHVGIVGLGGGGSHVAQQLAHIGVENFVLCDPDYYEDKNHNRTVGERLRMFTPKQRKCGSRNG